jgi:uncharacterized protein YbjT (DUF2867 family)
MKIVLTGSLGNISKPLAIALLKNAHEVTIISSKADRQNEIEAIGATAAIGTMYDVDFLTKTFEGADVVYCMETLDSSSLMHDPNFTFEDVVSTISKIVNNYKRAILESGVTKVIHLSSIGAHTDQGTGFLLFHHQAERILRSLPDHVSIKFMRPVSFYYNLLQFVPVIKMMSKGFLGSLMALRNYGLLGLFGGKRGVILSNYGGKTKNPLVSPLDIASVIAEEIEKPFEGRTFRYIASEELTCDEEAKILGESIGKPYLKWGTISDKQLLNAMKDMKMNPSIAKAFVETNNAGKTGKLFEDYYRHRPLLGKTKLNSFAPEFADAYYK